MTDELSLLNIAKGIEGLILPKLGDGDSVVFICRDNNEITQVAQRIGFFDPSCKVLQMPQWDCLPYDKISPNAAITYQRLKSLSEIDDSNCVVLTTTMGLIQKVPPVLRIKESAVNIGKKQKISQHDVLRYLVANGFTRSINAMDSGEFAARGSIIDIVPTDEKFGYRLDFFGSLIESIRTFDVETQTSIEQVESFKLLPSCEVMLSDTDVEVFKDNYRSKFGVNQDIIYESVIAKRKSIGIEHWLPLFYERCSTLFDYLPEGAQIISPFDFKTLLEEEYKLIYSQFELRSNPKLQKADGINNILEASELYSEEEDLDFELSKRVCKKYSPFNFDEDNFKSVDFISQTAKTKEISVFEELAGRLQVQTYISCFTNASRERLASILKDHDITSSNIDSWAERQTSKGIVGLFVCPIEHGFQTKDFTVFSEQDVLGQRLNRQKASKSKKSKASIMSGLTNLYPGDLVVHKENGIGRFEKLEQLKVGRTIHDFVKLIYAGDDKFYLPVENLDQITAYGSDNAVLDKLGSLGWQSRKAKLKQRIKIAAEKLLKIAADRNVVSMPQLEFNDEIFNKFCESFPYVETDDQLKAVEDIVEDFSAQRPMDRLVCGDVGFGKTEVALRAICKMLVSSEPSQIAILVPTTLLARQHYKTLKERFVDFPFKIAQLSKFTPRKDVKSIKQSIAEGQVDIVVGTHMLLAKDMKFKNLGLIIIDEEQHFGVGQKESLKELKTGCHVLTLSATPIPRTLQMSLFGIKDLSIIATPPVDRLPIKTYVIPHDTVTLREAILREHYRGGRTFYITPRVAYLDSIMASLKEFVPEVKVVKAHGQMTASQLDEIMNDFYDGKYDVLVSTNIIESGLDVPQANTMIIDRADLYGLAQLYQIRGRVGRSNIQAYSYLTFPPNKRLSDTAEKRLSVISSFESLGAGFSIASHDMDIRGYGNIVGEEQSGQVKEVGVELYQAMLQEAIDEIQTDVEVKDVSWSPTLNLGLSVQIPERYIPDNSLRLSLYRQIANLANPEELDAFAVDMIDRFGAIPQETEHLFQIVNLKYLAKKANIEKIDVGEKGVLIAFKDNTPASTDKVLDLINSNPIRFRYRADQKIFMTYLPDNEVELVKKLEDLLMAVTI